MTDGLMNMPAPRSSRTDWPAPPTAGEFLHVGPTKTLFPGSLTPGSLTGARQQFDRFQALHLRNLFEAPFFNTLMRTSAASAFGPEGGSTPGFREVELSPQRTGRIINLTLNRPEVLRWLEAVTDCGPLDHFEGRVAQTLCRPGDELVWHDDLPNGEKRRLALVVNLSTEAYTGGEFQLRRTEMGTSGGRLFEHRYTEPNSAILFRVGHDLEHRVLPLSTGGPRRVFAGWAFGSAAL
jgi:hypothetical protein